MTTIRTTLGWGENARKWRFEPTGNITQTNVQKAVEQVQSNLDAAAGKPPAIIPKNIAFANSPYTVLATDYLILVDTSGGAVTVNMMAAASRNNLEVEIKDSTGNANANNISVVANGAETIDGLATYPMASDFGAFKFKPITGGYSVI